MIECHVGNYREVLELGPIFIRHRIVRRGKIMVFRRKHEWIKMYRYEVMP